MTHRINAKGSRLSPDYWKFGQQRFRCFVGGLNDFTFLGVPLKFGMVVADYLRVDEILRQVRPARKWWTAEFHVSRAFSVGIRVLRVVPEPCAIADLEDRLWAVSVKT